MSEQKHTPEPWSIDRFGGINAGEELLLLGGIRTPMTAGQRMDEGKSNARRIVACVNWCAGNSTEGMERAVEIGRPYSVERDSSIERELETTRQRDELLAALELAVKDFEYVRNKLDGSLHCDATMAIMRMDEAIASAKDQFPDATKMIGAPATANYPHGSLGEAGDSEGGEA